MAIIQLEAQISPQQLLKAVDQLPKFEFEQFVKQILVRRAQRNAPRLSATESELLLKINQGIPADLQRKYDELISKRRAETIISEEYSELLRLTNQIEKLDAERVKWLIELARYRQISLPTLMDQLGIQAPPVVFKTCNGKAATPSNRTRTGLLRILPQPSRIFDSIILD